MQEVKPNSVLYAWLFYFLVCGFLFLGFLGGGEEVGGAGCCWFLVGWFSFM